MLPQLQAAEHLFSCFERSDFQLATVTFAITMDARKEMQLCWGPTARAATPPADAGSSV